jgi:LPS-assembly lipoprotein
MWSSERTHRLPRREALLGLMALAGCGFSPAYAPGGAALALRGRISFTTADTPFDFRLAAALEKRLGRADAPSYALAVTTTVSEVSAAITQEGSVTRFNLPGRADWVLRDDTTDKVLATGTATNFASYSATGTTVATRTAARDAAARLAVMLADIIVTQLIAAAQDFGE